jgi:hypothetical protein
MFGDRDLRKTRRNLKICAVDNLWLTDKGYTVVKTERDLRNNSLFEQKVEILHMSMAGKLCLLYCKYIKIVKL